MKSVVIHAEGSVRVEERPIPQIQTDDDVLIKVISSGLCGSDIPRMKFWCALFAQGYAAQISRVFLPKGHTIILSSLAMNLADTSKPVVQM